VIEICADGALDAPFTDRIHEIGRTFSPSATSRSAASNRVDLVDLII
jgi:hypothetical protein